jgi:serine/threonine protein kinase
LLGTIFFYNPGDTSNINSKYDMLDEDSDSQSKSDSKQAVQRMIILDQQWIIKLFATVCTTKHGFVKNGTITLANLYNQLWRDYPAELHPALVHLFDTFEIMYRLPEDSSADEGTADALLVPSLLPVPKPADLMSPIWPDKSASASQYTRHYQFEFVPMGLFSRFMFKLMKIGAVKRFWRYGVLIKHRQIDSQALVELKPTANALMIQVRGSDEGSDFFARVCEMFEFLLDHVYRLPTKIQYVDPFSNSTFTREQLEEASLHGQWTLSTGKINVSMAAIAPELALTNATSIQVDIDTDVVIGEQIGEGAFANVFRGELRGDIVAIKRLNMTGADDQKIKRIFTEFRKEVMTMSTLHHPCVVNLRAFSLQMPYSLLMEYIPHGTLHGYLKQDRDTPLPWTMRLRIAYDMAAGMAHLHSIDPPLIHKDLKSPNVLMSGLAESAPVVSKIADFGISGKLYAQKFRGTKARDREVENPTWLAPEIIREEPYTSAADVYPYGIMLWELLTRQHPFEEFNYSFNYDLEEAIKNGQRPTIPEDAPASFSQLIRDCWDSNPRNRPSFREIVDLRLPGIVNDLAPSLAPVLEQVKVSHSAIEEQWRAEREVLRRELADRRQKEVEEGRAKLAQLEAEARKERESHSVNKDLGLAALEDIGNALLSGGGIASAFLDSPEIHHDSPPTAPSPPSGATPKLPKEILRIFLFDGTQKTLSFDSSTTFADLQKTLAPKLDRSLDISNFAFFEVVRDGASSIQLDFDALVTNVVTKWANRSDTNANRIVFQAGVKKSQLVSEGNTATAAAAAAAAAARGFGRKTSSNSNQPSPPLGRVQAPARSSITITQGQIDASPYNKLNEAELRTLHTMRGLSPDSSADKSGLITSLMKDDAILKAERSAAGADSTSSSGASSPVEPPRPSVSPPPPAMLATFPAPGQKAPATLPAPPGARLNVNNRVSMPPGALPSQQGPQVPSMPQIPIPQRPTTPEAPGAGSGAAAQQPPTPPRGTVRASWSPQESAHMLAGNAKGPLAPQMPQPPKMPMVGPSGNPRPISMIGAPKMPMMMPQPLKQPAPVSQNPGAATPPQQASAPASPDLGAPVSGPLYKIEGDWSVSNKTAGGAFATGLWRRNPQWYMQVSAPTRVRVALSQSDSPQLPHIGFYVLNSLPDARKRLDITTGVVYQPQHFLNAKEVDTIVTVPEGCYTVVPATFQPGQENHFFLNIQGEHIKVAKAIEWNEAEVAGAWTAEKSGGCMNNAATWKNNPTYTLRLPLGAQKLTIVLSPDKRDVGMGFYVFPNNNLSAQPVGKSKFTMVSTLTELSLPAGEYLVVPTTFQAGVLGNFTLSLYADQPCTLA